MPSNQSKQQSTTTSFVSIYNLCLQLMTSLLIQSPYPKSQGLWFIFLMTCAALTEHVRGEFHTVTLHGKPQHDDLFVINTTEPNSKTIIHGFEFNKNLVSQRHPLHVLEIIAKSNKKKSITDRFDITAQRIKHLDQIELVNQGNDSELVFPSGHIAQLVGVNWETLLHYHRWYNFFNYEGVLVFSPRDQRPDKCYGLPWTLDYEGLRYPHTEVTYQGQPAIADNFRLLPLPTQRTVISHFDTARTRTTYSIFDTIDLADSHVTNLGQIKISIGDHQANLTFPNGHQVQLQNVDPIPLLQRFDRESVYGTKPFYFYATNFVIPGALELENKVAEYDTEDHSPIHLRPRKTAIINNFESVFHQPADHMPHRSIQDSLAVLDFSEINKNTSLKIQEDNHTAIIRHDGHELVRMPNFDARKLCQLADVFTNVTGFSQLECNIEDFIYLSNLYHRIYLGAVRSETLRAGLPFLEQLSLHTNLFSFDVSISLEEPLKISFHSVNPDDRYDRFIQPQDKQHFRINSLASMHKFINDLQQASIALRRSSSSTKLPRERFLRIQFEKAGPKSAIEKYSNITTIEILLAGQMHQVHAIEKGKFPLFAPYPLLPQFGFRNAVGAWEIGLPSWMHYDPMGNALVGQPNENQMGTTLLQATWAGEQGMERELLDVKVLPPLTWLQWLMTVENSSRVFKEFIKLFVTLYVLAFATKYTQQFQRAPQQYARFFQGVKDYQVISRQDIDNIYQEYKVIEQSFLHNVNFTKHLLEYTYYFKLDFSDKELVIREKIFSMLQDKYPKSSSPRQPNEQIDSELRAEIIFTILLKEFCGIEGYGQLRGFFKWNCLGDELEEIEANLLAKLFNYGGLHKITNQSLTEENGDAVVKWNEFISSITDTHIKFYDHTRPGGGIGANFNPPLTFLAYQNAIMFYVFELLYLKGVTQDEFKPSTPLPGPS